MNLRSKSPDSSRLKFGFARVLLLGLLAIEMLAITFQYDAKSIVESSDATWALWLSHAGQAFKVLVVYVVAVIVGIGPRLRSYFEILGELSFERTRTSALVAHAICFAGFYWLSGQVFGNPGSHREIESSMPAYWLLSLVGVIVFWLVALFPVSFWVRFVRDERYVLCIAGVMAILVSAFSAFSQQLWPPLSEATFVVSATLLNFVYPHVIVDSELFLLGTPQFVVHIAAACSGYEGIGLVTVFTALFLSVFRRDFKFPQALLLFPIGIVAIWCFNAIRIVLLIIIGEEISPSIAVGGFHSQAGWISFILVSVGLLVFSYNLKFFTHGDHGESKSLGINTPVALLLPLVVLLSMTLLTSALSADIDWLYPARVIATGAVLIALWHHYRLTPYILAWTPVLAGGAVFVVWLVLVPDNPERSVLVGNELSQLSGGAVVLWLTFRVIGSVITVPLAEELAFRGYILGRLSKSTFKVGEKIRFSWIAWLVSSLLFGLMHSAWIAGMIAGLVYGLVRYQRNKISDAIVAHAVTNLMLSGYVILTGTWSLW